MNYSGWVRNMENLNNVRSADETVRIVRKWYLEIHGTRIRDGACGILVHSLNYAPLSADYFGIIPQVPRALEGYHVHGPVKLRGRLVSLETRNGELWEKLGAEDFKMTLPPSPKAK